MFNAISRDVVFHKMFINASIQDIIYFARTNKANYKEFVENFKGLWNRSVVFSPEELQHNPLLPLFKIIDGLQKLSFSQSLFIKNKNLLSGYKIFKSSALLSKYRIPCQSFTREIYKKGFSFDRYDASVETRIKADLAEARYLKHDIFRSRALMVLSFLAGIFDFMPISLLLSVYHFFPLSAVSSINLRFAYCGITFYSSLLIMLRTTNTVGNLLDDSMRWGNTSTEMRNFSYRCGFWITGLATCLMIVLLVKNHA